MPKRQLNPVTFAEADRDKIAADQASALDSVTRMLITFALTGARPDKAFPHIWGDICSLIKDTSRLEISMSHDRAGLQINADYSIVVVFQGLVAGEFINLGMMDFSGLRYDSPDYVWSIAENDSQFSPQFGSTLDGATMEDLAMQVYALASRSKVTRSTNFDLEFTHML